MVELRIRRGQGRRSQQPRLEQLEARIVLAPVLSGNAIDDFVKPDTVRVEDPGGIGDVGIPNNAPSGTVSGWDIEDVYFDYDHASDSLAVGVDCRGICGDADGDGDPSQTADYNPGADVPDLGQYESFSMLIDTDSDYSNMGLSGDFEVVVGVSLQMDINDFAAFDFVGNPLAPHSDFGSELSNNISLFQSPSASAPDLEFTISNFSTLPGANFSPGQAFQFQTNFFMGSIVDGGIGEEYVAAIAQAVVVEIPAPASISACAWEDSNADGLEGSSEHEVGSMDVNLLDENGQVVASSMTDSAGCHTFDMVEPGDYSVEFVLPADFHFTQQGIGNDPGDDSDADPTTGRSLAITVDPGEQAGPIEAGIYKKAALGNFVWEDADANGIFDIGELPINGVTVRLHDSQGNEVASAVTDDDGIYSFLELMPGDYSVSFARPSGYTFTAGLEGADRAMDSDPDPTLGRTQTITLMSGEENPTIDAGLFRTVSIGDFVFEDLNADGVQDPAEPGISGVIVELLRDTGSVIDTTTTDAQGNYLFDDLVPGSYSVRFSQPSNWESSPDAIGGAGFDSDADPVTGETSAIMLMSGDTEMAIDAGYYRLTRIGNFVWDDTDADGKQDSNEPGIPNVLVELLSPDGTVQGSMNTDSAGKYEFAELTPGGYRVRFNAPAGMVFTSRNASNERVDSNANKFGGIRMVMVESGSGNMTVDAGLFTPVSLGDHVWLDDDGDGVRDSSESGVSGVRVKVRNASGKVVARTNTDADGDYQVTGLRPGEYVVEFVKPQSMEFSPRRSGVDRSQDSNADRNSGKSSKVTLSSGDSNMTIDAGLVSPSDPPPPPPPPPPPSNNGAVSSVSGFVYFDSNDNGSLEGDEPGIPGVQIILTGEDNFGKSVRKTARTNNNGGYVFRNLVPGKYNLTEQQPTEYSDRQETVGRVFNKSNGRAVSGSVVARIRNDQFIGIPLKGNQDGRMFNFGEGVLRLGALSKQLFLNSSVVSRQIGRAARVTDHAKVNVLRAPYQDIETVIVVNGTNGNDEIVFKPVAGKQVQVRVNGKVQGTYKISTIDRVVAYGHKGNDVIVVNPNLNIDAQLNGGSGNDKIFGGAGSDILLGGSGRDVLNGRDGRDMLIGGVGADVLTGTTSGARSAKSDDIIVTGKTIYDTYDLALRSIVDEWTSNRSTNARARIVRRGTSSVPQLDSTTLIDDRVGDRIAQSSSSVDLVFSNNKDRAVPL